MVASGDRGAVRFGKGSAGAHAATISTETLPILAGKQIQGLYRVLNEAAVEAGHRGEPVLASWVGEIAPHDPLDLFEQAKGQVRLLWSDAVSGDGSARITLVGAGSVAHFLGHGTARFRSIRQAWEGLAGRILVEGPSIRGTGPLLMGGFAFDPEDRWTDSLEGEDTLRPGAPAGESLSSEAGPSQRGLRWPFPDGLLMVPEVLVTSSDEGWWVTLNALVRPGDSAEELAAPLMGSAEPLLESETEGRAGSTETESARQAETPREPLRVDDPDPEPWMEEVALAAEAVRAGRVRKVVLARPLRVRRSGGFESARILASLAAANPLATLFALDLGEATFLGATPERLARVESGWVESMALAGSAPRHQEADLDDHLGRELLESVKNREEHQVVVDALREGMAPLTDRLHVAGEPSLLKLPTVQHLLSPVRGRLASGAGLLDVVERLHPTPAVGGWPRPEALRRLRELEGWDRGWYAAPFGWIDAAGDGAFAVAIRSGLLKGDEAHLFAGCGIVGASEPRAEYEEWRLKLRPLLAALEEAAR